MLDKSISHHDPAGSWHESPITLNLRETRLNAEDRHTTVIFDQKNSVFELNQTRDKHQYQYLIEGDQVKILFDGQETKDTALIRKYRLNHDRARVMQNFYTYLYGLPMKLKDPGTNIDPVVQDTTFQSINVYGLKVTYDPQVGDDIWYFYFDKSSFALRGYRFYHDESANDGEYITLEDEAKIDQMRLPKERKWYTNREDAYLGSDIITN